MEVGRALYSGEFEEDGEDVGGGRLPPHHHMHEIIGEGRHVICNRASRVHLSSLVRGRTKGAPTTSLTLRVLSTTSYIITRIGNTTYIFS